MGRRKMVLTVIVGAVLLISVIAGTYAFFTATVNDSTSDNITVTSGSLSLTLNDMDVTSLTTWNITPSDLSRTLYLRVTNNSPISVYAKLLFKGLTNTYSEYLVYTLEQVNQNKTSLNPTKVLKNQVGVPASASASNQEMANYISVPAGQTYYYKLTIEYLYSTTVNQSNDVGKKFYTGFGLEESSKPTKIISKAGSNLALGDKIAIGDQNFWVISNTSGTIRALAEYNINVGSNKNTSVLDGLQHSTIRGDYSGGTKYGNVGFGTSSIYSISTVKSLIENYVALLNSTYGTNVTGDAITKAELESPLGCSSSSHTCSGSSYPWVMTTSYWTRSAGNGSLVWGVRLNGDFSDNNSFNNNNYLGVRPVIVISESSI